MPINASQEYFAAERRYDKAKTPEEKILYLEEMIRLAPKHKGAENMLAQFRGRLAKMKKDLAARKKQKKGGKKQGVVKEGEAQACLLGYTMSGKSTIISKLTDARPAIADHPYTTTRPVIGMMDWSGVKVQLVEIPATLDPEHISVCRSADLVVLVVKDNVDAAKLRAFCREHYVRTKSIIVNVLEEDIGDIRKRIWAALGLIIVYTKSRKGQISPMALPAGANVREFALRIHKDFVKDFRFAFLWRNGRKSQIGLNYILQEGDIVEMHIS